MCVLACIQHHLKFVGLLNNILSGDHIFFLFYCGLGLKRQKEGFEWKIQGKWNIFKEEQKPRKKVEFLKIKDNSTITSTSTFCGCQVFPTLSIIFIFKRHLVAAFFPFCFIYFFLFFLFLLLNFKQLSQIIRLN